MYIFTLIVFSELNCIQNLLRRKFIKKKKLELNYRVKILFAVRDKRYTYQSVFDVGLKISLKYEMTYDMSQF